MADQRKALLLAVAGYDLAETGRMIEIARAAQEHFDVLFASYGGHFEKLIEDEGFPLRRMEPRLTPEKLERLRVVLSGETFNTVDYFNYKELVPPALRRHLFKRMAKRLLRLGSNSRAGTVRRIRRGSS